jgi:Protein of unknown function (DUF3631)
MDENTVDELPPEGAEIPTEGAHDAAQTGLVPIIEVWPDDADSSNSSSRHNQSNSPESRIELVVDLATFLDDYVVFENPDCLLALVLWILGTHTWTTSGVPCPFRAYPYLQVTSMFKGSGKSTLLDLLYLVCRDPEIFTDPTGATIFRVIRDRRPTLLCDQQEKLGGSAINVLNTILLTGYIRDAAVPRVVKGEVVKFPTGCPKACALIGDLNDTLRGRCIIVKMRRATPREDLDSNYEAAEERGHALRARAIASVSDAMDEIKAGIPEFDKLPLRYREKQIWRPLFTMCAVFCPARMSEFVRAAADLSVEKKTGRQYRAHALRESEKAADQEMWGRWLLEDVVKVMGAIGRDTVETAEIITALYALDEAPWRKFGGPDEIEGDGLTAQKMAHLLEPFGVGPRRFWFGPKKRGNQKRGYKMAELEEGLRRNPSPRHP